MKVFMICFISIVVSGCNFFKIDSCLDKGGRWDKQKEECIYHE